MYFGESLAFRRNILRPSSGCESEPNKKPQTVGKVSNPEVGAIFFGNTGLPPNYAASQLTAIMTSDPTIVVRFPVVARDVIIIVSRQTVIPVEPRTCYFPRG
jgi:hypothetical protein